MSSNPHESFYPADVEVEESRKTRPHPPAPLLPVAIGLILGIVCDARWTLRSETYVCGFIVATLATLGCARRRWLLRALLALASATAGGVLHDAHFRRLPENHIARFVTAEPILVSLSGTVVRAPWLVQSPRASTPAAAPAATRCKFVMALQEALTELGSVAVRGLLPVTLQEPVFDLYAGERVRVFGKLYRPAPPDNPGEPNWALIQRRQGVYAGLICEFSDAIEKLPPTQGEWLNWLNRLRLEANTLLLDDVLDTELDKRSLLSAVVLGQRTHVDPAISEAFRRTGTAHLLALSGLNIAMLAYFVWLGGRFAALSKRKSAGLVFAALVSYALLVEPSPSVIRASIIGITFCAGYMLRTPVNSLNSMCLAAILLLVWNPLQLFHPGFQLSFVVTLGIIYLTPLAVSPLQDWLRPRSTSAAADVMGRKIGVADPVEQNVRALTWTGLRLRTLRTIVYTLYVSLTAWLVGTPLAAFHFNSLFTYGWPFTAIISPFMFLTMLAGFMKLGLGLVWPTSGTVLGPILTCSADMLVWVVKLLARTPAAAIDVPRPPGWWLILYYALLTGLVLRSSPTAAKPIGSRGLRIVAVMILFFIAVMPYWRLRLTTDELRITVLDVGSGSATIIEMPDGEVWLYDAGSLGDYDVGHMTVMPALRERGIRRINTAIISHPNYDHYSGLFSLCEHLRIERVLISPHFELFALPGEADHRLLEEFRRRGIEIDYLQTGAQRADLIQSLPEGVGLEVLWPPVQLPPGTTPNDTSLVIRFTHGKNRILLTGDIERYAQEQILASGMDPSADVLVLPHHGSVTPATRRFINAVGPRYSLRSSGKRRAAVPSEIEEIVAGCAYLNTADVGAITILLQRDDLSVEGFHAPLPPAGDEGDS